MTKPRLLDLFCGAGGAARGYQQAGFYVVGVDNRPQPRYAGDEFIQADAMTFPLDGFDAIHASPPCQRYSAMSACRPGLAADYPDLIGATRDRVRGVTYVIENVPRSPLRRPTVLCGTMFGLPLYRHRLFESSVALPNTDWMELRHALPVSRAGHWKPGTIMSVAGHFAPMAEARRAMGIAWMNREEMAEAIPPAYAEYVGRQLMAALNENRG